MNNKKRNITMNFSVALIDRIKKASKTLETTITGYIRTSVIEKLKRDGSE